MVIRVIVKSKIIGKVYNFHGNQGNHGNGNYCDGNHGYCNQGNKVIMVNNDHNLQNQMF